MCMALAPAHFSSTIVYAGEVSSLGIHVLGYQNDAQSYPRSPYGQPGYGQAASSATGNAMLLHFPAAEPMTEQNLLDTTPCPNFLRDLERAIDPPQMAMGAAYPAPRRPPRCLTSWCSRAASTTSCWPGTPASCRRRSTGCILTSAHP